MFHPCWKLFPTAYSKELHQKTLLRFVDIGNAIGRKVTIFNFTEIPFEKILERNKKRDKEAKVVDEDVIDNMAKKIPEIQVFFLLFLYYVILLQLHLYADPMKLM